MKTLSANFLFNIVEIAFEHEQKQNIKHIQSEQINLIHCLFIKYFAFTFI
jgi:hypothetical protein